jgi:hypothetical protein
VTVCLCVMKQYIARMCYDALSCDADAILRLQESGDMEELERDLIDDPESTRCDDNVHSDNNSAQFQDVYVSTIILCSVSPLISISPHSAC